MEASNSRVSSEDMRPIKDRAKRIKCFFVRLLSLITIFAAYWTTFRAIRDALRSFLGEGGYFLESGVFILATVLLAKFGLFFSDFAERLEEEITAEDLAIKLQDPEFRKQYEQQRQAEQRVREAEEKKQEQERKWKEARQLRRQHRFREAQERLRQEQEEELRRTRALQLANVDEMSGTQFEKYLIHLLEYKGIGRDMSEDLVMEVLISLLRRKERSSQCKRNANRIQSTGER